MNQWFTTSAGWYALGFMGQLLFSSRFFVQWFVSERSGRVVIPKTFWYLSMLGGIALTIYAIHRHDPVFAVGQGAGLLVYARNLMLHQRSVAQ